MQNYSQVYADTLAEFQSPFVPANQGDEGKGQVNARAVYKIHTTMNANVGHITKSGGQTQYHGMAVDACLDKSDGTGADYLTDVDLGNGMREIRVAYTPYAPPPPGTPLPPTNWQQPTDADLTYGGPLVLKTDSGGGTPPEPTPVPPTDNEAVLARIDALEVTLLERIDLMQTDLEAHSDMNTAKIQTQIHDLVEDAEETLLQIAKLLLLHNRPGRGPEEASVAEAEAVGLLGRRIDERRAARRGTP